MKKKPEHSIANMKYDRHRLDIKQEIDLLTKKLKSHHSKQKLEPSNYGFAGDAEFVLQKLQEINEF